MTLVNAHPEPDRIAGAPHPRDTIKLLGQSRAKTTFLNAFRTNRMHHGWLIHGPRGIGKATLAWTIARFLLATSMASNTGLSGETFPTSETLEIPQDHPVAQRLRAGSEPGLFVLRRPFDQKTNRLKAQITVDEVRKLKNFFALSATDGGRRVVIVDSADEMNISAANAILKLLEEPPERCCLFLISHQPAGLLPTLRSRCCDLRLQPLAQAQIATALKQIERAAEPTTYPENEAQNDEQTLALAELAAGSVGAAVRLRQLDGLALYHDLVGVFNHGSEINQMQAIKLAESAAVRGAEDRFDMLVSLFDTMLIRLARYGVTRQMPTIEIVNDEFDVLRRAAPDAIAGRAWAEIAQQIGARMQHGRTVNLDPAALILDTVFKMQRTAAGGA